MSGGGSVAAAHVAPSHTAATLFEEHATSIYNYVCRVVGDRGEAEDITQEVFLRAHRHLAAHGALEMPRPWLYKVASNACCDYLRRRRDVPTEGQHDSVVEHSDGFARSQMAHLVDAALRRLELRQCQALILRDWRGLPHEEIAIAFGISVGASQALVSRSRDAFQREFTRLALGMDQAGEATTTMGMGALLGLAPVLALPAGLLALPHALVGATAASAGSAAHAASSGLFAKALGSASVKLMTTGVIVLAASVGGGAMLAGRQALPHSNREPVVVVAVAGSSATKSARRSPITTTLRAGSPRRPDTGTPDRVHTTSGGQSAGGTYDEDEQASTTSAGQQDSDAENSSADEQDRSADQSSADQSSADQSSASQDSASGDTSASASLDEITSADQTPPPTDGGSGGD